MDGLLPGWWTYLWILCSTAAAAWAYGRYEPGPGSRSHPGVSDFDLWLVELAEPSCSDPRCWRGW